MHSEVHQVPPARPENPVSLPVLNEALKKVLKHNPETVETAKDRPDVNQDDHEKVKRDEVSS